MKLINRSFGFEFRGEFLQGSVFVADGGGGNNQLDVLYEFKGEEFPTSQDFFNKNNLTGEERDGIFEKVNQILNKK